ncbi:MAG: hypothetical protein XD93_0255 [candidate division WS6 bacterium 34_10]|uniref:Uncharacterized protein n=1 Tax=candidate division WS6 bacterium 34_10 TaxID=1641389 RepID=A0A101HJF1_9BACT|nr:MAG: hypothetical protein XD93_0255 [candidate division WS6 bacterium 34_10]
MNSTFRYILITFSVLLIIVAGILIVKYRPIKEVFEDRDVSVAEIEENETDSEGNSQEPTESDEDSNATINQEIDDALKDIDKQLAGIDGNTDFADFGVIE